MNGTSPFEITRKQARTALYVILAAGILLRLFFITAPIADDQSWNQTSAATVARNFANNGIDFFHTRWDVLHPGSNEPRIEVEEAPIYHAAAAVLSTIGGGVVPWGRAISIIFGTLSTLYLYLLVKRKTDIFTALTAAAIFAFAPYPLYFFRTFMSDPAMIFSMIAALYYFDRYCETETIKDVALAGVFTALAGLFKPFGLQICVPILIMGIYTFKWRIFTKPALYALAIFSIAPTMLWLYWAAKVGTLGGVTQGQSVVSTQHLWGTWDMLIDLGWYNKLQSRLLDRMATPLITVFFAAALIFKASRKRTTFFLWWLAGVAFYFVLVKSGNKIHNYYQLPAVAPFAAIGAIGLSELLSRLKAKKRIPALIGAVIVFAVLSAIYVIPHYKQDLSSYNAGLMANKQTRPGDKIMVLDPGVTRKNQVIFASEREGWYFGGLKKEQIPEYKELGAKVVVVVIEQSQSDQKSVILEHLAENHKLLARASGEFNHRSTKPENRWHDIYIYSLDVAE